MIGLIMEYFAEKRALKRAIAPLMHARAGRHARSGRYSFTGYKM